jgi:hypothetical protein
VDLHINKWGSASSISPKVAGFGAVPSSLWAVVMAISYLHHR